MPERRDRIRPVLTPRETAQDGRLLSLVPLGEQLVELVLDDAARDRGLDPLSGPRIGARHYDERVIRSTVHRRADSICRLFSGDQGLAGSMAAAPDRTSSRVVRAIMKTGPHPVAASPSRGSRVAAVIRGTSSHTSLSVFNPRSGRPIEAFATPAPDGYSA